MSKKRYQPRPLPHKKRGPKPKPDPLAAVAYLPPHLRAILAAKPSANLKQTKAYRKIDAEPRMAWTPGKPATFSRRPQAEAALKEARRKAKNQRERDRYRAAHPKVKHRTKWTAKDKARRSRCKRSKP